MGFDLGINVVEVDGNVAPSIQAAPTSNAGFAVRTKRGVPGEVKLVTSWRKFEKHFGGHRKDAYGAYAVSGFFDNGGSQAYVKRVVTNNAQAASWSPADDSGLTLTAARLGEEDPGPWAHDVSVSVARDDDDDDESAFTLQVRKGDEVVETWERMSVSDDPGDGARSIVEALNDEVAGSQYVKASLTSDPAAPPTMEEDDEPVFEALSGGTDPDPGNSHYIAAFDAFETKPIQLLCCPESSADDVALAGIEHCERRGDALYVGHTPAQQGASDATAYGQTFQADNRYGALYFPWIKVADPLGGRRLVPPTGHVLGVYARTARERGVWKAPAGNAAIVRGAVDVEHEISDAVHTRLVKDGSVNAVRFVQGLGIVVDSSRTLSTSNLWLYVNVRLLFNFVKSSLEDGLRWVVQEPNDETLWNKVKANTVTPFLMGLWSRGAFGPGGADDVFTVKCDEDTNTPEDIQQGRFNLEVYFYPSRPAETIVITVGQQEGGASSSES